MNRGSESKTLPPPVTLDDIIQMRQIDSLTLSPDGQTIAFREIIPLIEANRVTVQWYSVPVNGGQAPKPLGRAQDPIFQPLFDLIADGMSAWSADGTGLFVLASANSRIAIHWLEHGGRDQEVTHDTADVESFTPDASGASLTYMVRAARDEIARDQDAEDRRGVHLDTTIFADGMRLTRSFGIGDRMISVRDTAGTFPQQAFAGPQHQRSISLPQDARVAQAQPLSSRADGINPFQQEYVEKGVLPRPVSVAGTRFELKKLSDGTPELPLGIFRLIAASSNGRETACTSALCTGSSVTIRQVLVDRSTGEAVLLREEHGSGVTSAYRWSPSANKVAPIYVAGNSLNGGSAWSGAGCLLSGGHLLCVESGPTIAPRLVSIDVRTGKSRILADPNADLDAKAFPRVRPFRWVDRLGNPSSGVLVLPDRRHGERLPLVLTTYGCRGFLRGGTAMVTPEFLLAQRGIAALCVNHDPLLPDDPDDRARKIALKAHRADLEVYRAAVQALVDQNIVDPTRVGISGHSYSAMLAAFAISHTKLFSVASLGGGISTDPVSFYVRAPLPDAEGRSAIAAIGLPPIDKDPDHIWSSTSAALNAASITAPVLMQPPENEWLGDLQLYSALRDLDRPADLYVFPNAGHMLGRYPAQLLARATRSADWFAFWLTGREYRDTGNIGDYENWEKMRAKTVSTSSAGIEAVASRAAS